ncbi:hypothetical protein M885DRAFT_549070 [Pelagophyceae sp. CCMP2097]|nr:hypothetical protein M885DRAFT_549070 [Pelagophyceae sp. CCMP2097]
MPPKRERAAVVAKEAEAAPGRRTVRVKFSQDEMLTQAVATEADNSLWIEVQRRAAMAKHGNVAYKTEKARSYARTVSRRGCPTMVTFAAADASLPGVICQDPAPPPTVELCAVTGARARYRDPRTGRAYSDKASFGALRGADAVPHAAPGRS